MAGVLLWGDSVLVFAIIQTMRPANGAHIGIRPNQVSRPVEKRACAQGRLKSLEVRLPVAGTGGKMPPSTAGGTPAATKHCSVPAAAIETLGCASWALSGARLPNPSPSPPDRRAAAGQAEPRRPGTRAAARRAQPFRQAGHEVFGQAGALVDQAGVHLDERGAGGDFFPGVGRGEDAAHADDGQLALVCR